MQVSEIKGKVQLRDKAISKFFTEEKKIIFINKFIDDIFGESKTQKIRELNLKIIEDRFQNKIFSENETRFLVNHFFSELLRIINIGLIKNF